MKNLVIAGGTDGIGLAFVKQLNLKKYNNIFVIGRSFTRIDELQAGNIIPLTCDITDQQAIQRVVATIDQPIDQFVNTIGTFYRNPIDMIASSDVIRHFELNTIGNIDLTNAILPKLKKPFAEILVCLATLALEGRENYALQSATKAAYKYYLDVLRKEKSEELKVMVLYPSSVNTRIFTKAGDTRDASKYPPPKAIANIMSFMLAQPSQVYIPELKVENFRQT